MKKKLIRITLIVLGSLVLIIGGLLTYVSISGIPKYPVQKITLNVERTPERIAKGKRIVSMLCANCHLNPETGFLTGHQLTEVDGFGKLYSRNITNDKQYGIGSWTDGEIAYFLRTGVKRDGQYVPPYMVKLPRVPDEDIYSIIAFLRSDDSLVRPQQVQDTACEPNLLAKILSRVAFGPFEYPKKPIAVIPVTDRVAYGRYLMNDLVQCYACHSADFKSMNDHQPELSEGYMGGNNEMLTPAGKRIYTANLTRDPQYGIGKWTREQFIKTVRDGFTPDNRPLRAPMDRFPELSDDEIGDMWDYLQTLPALHTQVRQPEELVLTGANITEGQRIYYKYSCYSCHGTQGLGTCDLRKGYLHYPSNDSLTQWIMHPSHYKPGTKMPDWAGVIQDNEYAALCDYVRLLGEQSKHASAATAQR